MWFKKNEQIPRRPEICGTPMASAVEKRDKCAVKKAYDYQYNQTLAIYHWDLRYKEMTDIERADIQIEIGKLRTFQKENAFGPWYNEDDVESRIRFKNE
jgi:hypothetical protein